MPARKTACRARSCRFCTGVVAGSLLQPPVLLETSVWVSGSHVWKGSGDGNLSIMKLAAGHVDATEFGDPSHQKTLRRCHKRLFIGNLAAAGLDRWSDWSGGQRRMAACETAHEPEVLLDAAAFQMQQRSRSLAMPGARACLLELYLCDGTTNFCPFFPDNHFPSAS